METDAERDDADPPSDRDDYDIVIYHSDSETDMATCVRDSIRTIQLDGRPPLRVEILADLMLPGTQPYHVHNHVIHRTTILMFLRTETFFCEPLNDFSVGAAIQDRVEHIKPERRWFVLPLDVNARTKIKGKAMINSLTGCTINAKGELLEQSKTKLKNLLLKNLLLKNLPAVPTLPAFSKLSLQEDIAEGRRRQGTAITKLLRLPGDSTAALQPQDPHTHTASIRNGMRCGSNDDNTPVTDNRPNSVSSAETSRNSLITFSSLPQCVVTDVPVQQQQQHENVLFDQQGVQQLPQLQQHDLQTRDKWHQQGARPKIPNAHLSVPLFSSPPLTRDKSNDYLGQTDESETSHEQPRHFGNLTVPDRPRQGKIVKASSHLENNTTDVVSASAELIDQPHLNDGELHDAMEMTRNDTFTPPPSLHSESGDAAESLDWKDLQNDCSHVHNTSDDRVYVNDTSTSEQNESVSLNVLAGGQNKMSRKTTTTSIATLSSLAHTLDQVRESPQLPLEAGALQFNRESVSKLSFPPLKSSTSAASTTPPLTLQQPLQSPTALQVIGISVDVADDGINRPQPPQPQHQHQPEQQAHLALKDLPESKDDGDSGVDSNYNSTQSAESP